MASFTFGRLTSMRILVVGKGGREHALAWKIAHSPKVEHIIVAPGNAGTASERKCSNADIDLDDVSGMTELALKEKIDLTIIGPEAPLSQGITDIFSNNGLACFGPTREAARLESSKIFAKIFCHRHAIPTANAEYFTKEREAIAWVKRHGLPLVVKADGLAAGKGVVIAKTFEEATQSIKDMLSGQSFGESGKQILIEEYLEGKELSYMALVSGDSFIPFEASQDHKRAQDGDKGPNTGGMGAYSPPPFLTPELREIIEERIVRPTLAGLKNDQIHYTGFLYFGLMIDRDKEPYLLEFNCRLGDPETQALMLRCRSDLLDSIVSILTPDTQLRGFQWWPKTSLSVVAASGGYPNDYRKGYVVNGLDQPLPEGTKLFHAGTVLHGDKVVTDGGRVLSVTGLGSNINTAREKVYGVLANLSFTDMYYRTDIGTKEP